jgi:hypothetical protein
MRYTCKALRSLVTRVLLIKKEWLRNREFFSEVSSLIFTGRAYKEPAVFYTA